MILPRKHYHPQEPRQGFTLVELLVVIVVIAILASIALPVMGKMRAAADSTSSVSNMRRLGAALATVAGENNFNLPVGYGLDTVLVGEGRQNYQKRLSIREDNTGAKKLNSQFGNTVTPTAWLGLFQNKTAAKTEKYPVGTTVYVGSTPYGFNKIIDTDVVNGPAIYGDKASGTWSSLKIPSQSTTMILADTWINTAYYSADATCDYSKPEGSPYAISYRHPGKKAALLFADWHIQMVTKAEVDANKGKWFDPAKQ